MPALAGAAWAGKIADSHENYYRARGVLTCWLCSVVIPKDAFITAMVPADFVGARPVCVSCRPFIGIPVAPRVGIRHQKLSLPEELWVSDRTEVLLLDGVRPKRAHRQAVSEVLQGRAVVDETPPEAQASPN